MPYTVDFMNIAPDTVEVAKVETTDISRLVVPADAMQFIFLDEDLKYVAPTYFVTEQVDIGDLKGLKARHPDANLHTGTTADTFALVSWTHPEGERWSGKILVPLGEHAVVVSRKDLSVVAKVA
jgi:hypothetical protein